MEPDTPEMRLLTAAVLTQEVSRRTAAISKSLPGPEGIGEYDLAAMVTDLEKVGQQSRLASLAIVASLRLRGKTWQGIGDLLGLTRQGAQQRYGQPEDDPE
jgi:hypothetical protein